MHCTVQFPMLMTNKHSSSHRGCSLVLQAFEHHSVCFPSATRAPLYETDIHHTQRFGITAAKTDERIFPWQYRALGVMTRAGYLHEEMDGQEGQRVYFRARAIWHVEDAICLALRRELFLTKQRGNKARKRIQDQTSS